MVRTIIKCYFDIFNRISCLNTSLHCFLNTFVDRLDKFFRNNPTFDFINELVSETWFLRLDSEEYVTILSTSTRLLRILVLFVDRFTDRFTVSNLWCTHFCFNFEFSFHSVNKDLKVKFTHSRDDCLAGLFVSRNTERRIFCSKLTKCKSHFFLVRFCLRLNRNRDNRIREVHSFKNHFVFV